MLILNGSQKALDFLNSELNDKAFDDRMMSFDDDGNEHKVLRCEAYIRLVNGWRTDDYEYKWDWNTNKKLAYAEQLSNWITEQFERIMNGEAHDLNPTPGEPNLLNSIH